MEPSPRLTAIVLTKNEEHDLPDCLASLQWCDEILVFDSFSTDRTCEIAQQMGAHVIQHPFQNYAQQRNAALRAAETEWVLFIDADERVPPELAEEIRSVLPRQDKDGWWIPRHNIIFGAIMHHTGWFPDYQLRLVRRAKAHYDPHREVHELIVLDGEAGYLQTPLIHHNYATLGEFLAKQRKYTAYEARVLFNQGQRPKPWSYILQPLRHFRWRYIELEGYKDGWRGLLLSLLMSYYNFWLYVHLTCLWLRAKRKRP